MFANSLNTLQQYSDASNLLASFANNYLKQLLAAITSKPSSDETD